MFLSCLTSLLTLAVSIVLWPPFFIITSINELCRIVIRRVFLPKNYEMIQPCSGNFVFSDMFNTRMVVVSLYSPDLATPSDILKDVDRFENGVFASKNPNGSLTYGDMKKTQVQKLGYGCLRDDTKSFQVSNHVKLYTKSSPQNGEYFTEDEFSKVILPEYLSCNMGEDKPQWEWLLFPRVLRNDGSFNSLRIFRWDHRYMDGACAGILMSEHIFDSWGPGKDSANPTPPPYIYNPNLSPPGQWAFLWIAKIWAFTHLPLICLMSCLSLLFVGESSAEQQPFATWQNSGRKVTSPVYSLDVGDLLGKGLSKGRGLMNFKSLLLKALSPVVYKAWKAKGQNDYKRKSTTSNVNIASFQALTPYQPGLHNQFTVLQANVDLNPNQGGAVIDPTFPIDMTLMFPFMYTNWIGRLPVTAIRKLAAPAESTIALNSIPFLKKTGSINGFKITQIGSWDCLYTPVGLAITLLGYGGKLFVTAFSVEACLSDEELNDVVQNYILQLKS